MTRFSLECGKWYAMELFDQQFGAEIRRCSPVRVDRLELKGGGSRRFDDQALKYLRLLQANSARN